MGKVCTLVNFIFVNLMPHSHFRWYVLQLQVFRDSRTAFKDACSIHTIGVITRGVTSTNNWG